jgi:hypothetical protein
MAIRTTLFWNGSESKRTIPIDRDGDNVATFRLTPGYKAFHAYCTDIGDQHTPDSEGDPLTVLDLQAIDPNYITDDEEEEDIAERDPSSGWTSKSSGPSNGSSIDSQSDPATTQTVDSEGVPTQPTQLDLDADPSATNAPAVIVDEEDSIPDNPTAELLRYHYNFGHAPFSKLQEIAKRKIIPK